MIEKLIKLCLNKRPTAESKDEEKQFFFQFGFFDYVYFSNFGGKRKFV